jgi:hypothetical protein
LPKPKVTFAQVVAQNSYYVNAPSSPLLDTLLNQTKDQDTEIEKNGKNNNER